MNNTKKIALAVALTFSACTALAQEINPTWYSQAYVGATGLWMKPDKGFGVDKNMWGGGIRGGLPVHQYFDIQAIVTQARGDLDKPTRDYWQTLYGVDALLMLSRQQIRPFVLFGIGGQHDHISRPLLHGDETNFYYQGGVGAQASINDRWSVQLDGRVVRGNTDHAKVGLDKSLTKLVTFGINYALFPPPQPTPAPTEAPPPPPTPAPTEAPPPPAKFEKVTLSASSLFGFDSAKLSMPQPKLDEIANTLQQNPSLTDITITGYTDRIGKTKYNHKLSERRANIVREYLISKGVDGNRLKAVGRGEENPVVECHQKKRKELIECLAPNRRVEIEQITVEKRVE